MAGQTGTGPDQDTFPPPATHAFPMPLPAPCHPTPTPPTPTPQPPPLARHENSTPHHLCLPACHMPPVPHTCSSTAATHRSGGGVCERTDLIPPHTSHLTASQPLPGFLPASLLTHMLLPPHHTSHHHYTSLFLFGVDRWCLLLSITNKHFHDLQNKTGDKQKFYHGSSALRLAG